MEFSSKYSRISGTKELMELEEAGDSGRYERLVTVEGGTIKHS